MRCVPRTTLPILAALIGIFILGVAPAMAHFLTSATATANCQGYSLTVTAIDLSVGAHYTINYSFTVVCSNGTTIQTGSINFTASASTMTETASGGALVPAGSDCTVTGSATLASFGSTVFININGQGTSPATVNCPAACQIPPSGTAIPGAAVSWNKFNTVGSGDVVWIHAHIGKPTGVPTTTVTDVFFTGVTFVLNGITYSLPNGELIFDPTAPTTPSTVFNSLTGWVTTLNPDNLSDEIFFDGNALPVDSNISGGGKATFNFTTSSNDLDLAFSWQWSAAVFTFWPGNNAADILPYHDSDHAGTPENTAVQKSLIQGPRGGGGSNFTGSWSGTGQGTCPSA